MQPITRASLAQFYDKYPVAPLDVRLQDTESKMSTLLSSIVAMCPKEVKDEIDAYSMKSALFTLDECLWRCRQLGETLQLIAHQDNIHKLPGFLLLSSSNPNARDDTLKVVQILKELSLLAAKCIDAAKYWQDDSKKKTEEVVDTLLPSNMVTRTVKNRRVKSEHKFQENLVKEVVKGLTVKEKYDMLWKQQLESREAVADIGNARGVYKFVLKHVAGVPKVLLDFAKEINSEQGPLEEVRERYGPTLYTLLNQFQLVTLCMQAVYRTVTGSYLLVPVDKQQLLSDEDAMAKVDHFVGYSADSRVPTAGHVIPSGHLTTNFDLTWAMNNMPAIQEAMRVLQPEFCKYCVFMHDLVLASPYFVSTADASKQPSPETVAGPSASTLPPKTTSVHVSPKVQQVGHQSPSVPSAV